MENNDLNEPDIEKTEELNGKINSVSFLDRLNIPDIIKKLSIILLVCTIALTFFDIITLIMNNDKINYKDVLGVFISNTQQIILAFIFWGISQFFSSIRDNKSENKNN